MTTDHRQLLSGTVSRRTFGLAAVAALGALAGCAANGAAGDRTAAGTTTDGAATSGTGAASSAGSTAAGSTSSQPTGSVVPSSAAPEAFTPVTIKHAYGETTIEKLPTAVVSAGYTEQDYLLALGVTPVAITDWYGDHPFGVWPWAQAALGPAQPKLLNLNDGFQFVDIAALRPDLIVALNSGMEQSDYDKLSRIAPTIPPLNAKDIWFAPWSKMIDPIAQAVGKPAQGNEIRDDIAGRFAAAAAANPSFAGAKAIFLQNAVYDGSFIAYQKGLSTDFLTDLGFEIPSEIDAFVREGEQAYIPVEQISVLDSADVLIWGTESDADKGALEKVPGFGNLTAVKEGRSVYTGGVLAGAIYFTSPLSLPYVLDNLVPMLATALT